MANDIGSAGRAAAYAILDRVAAQAKPPFVREVIREFRGEHRIRAEVSTRHPQVGPVLRGTITPATSPDWRCAWSLVDHDHSPVGDEPFVGDYMDVEAALLAATTGLDEEVPDHEL